MAAFAALVAIGSLAAACGDDDNYKSTEVPITKPTAAATSGAAAVSPASTQAASATVDVGDNRFEPSTLTVKAGTKVSWGWTGRNPHSVVGKFDGKDVLSQQQTAGSFVFTFDKPGTFEYQCGVHGASMPGKVIVQ